jgi:uncharacterized peroxidase-related enzyme
MSTSGYAVASGLKQTGRGPVRANLPVVEEADATGEIAEAYQYFREHFGRPAVPGILKCFSSSPEMLKIIIQLGSTLVFSEGVLGRRVKEMIATYVSSLNECPYCLDSHGASLCAQGGDEALLNALLTGDLGDVSISTPEGHLLEFVRKVTVESHTVDDIDILNLRASGWDEKQIAESIHVAAMFACFNRVANAFGLPSQDLLKHLHETGLSQHEEEIHR